ncbi:MAG: BREX system Lon protease-like protein BrxL [Candidatus Cloacimonetes bacterium]|nr:BREX system Lon protease-like protein BrxL [Candidatus Cloacimonadota bacterium]
MEQLDEKISDVFGELSIYKSPTINTMFSNKTLPSFIKDWLIKKYTMSNRQIDKDGMIDFMNKHLVGSINNVKRKLTVDNETVSLLSRFRIETDIKNNVLRFEVPDVGIKISDGVIPKYVAEENPTLKDGEHWGVISLMYEPPVGKAKGVINLYKFKPFQPYLVSLEMFREFRKQFSIDEWINILVKAMEYNPYECGEYGFSSVDKKLLLISRLLVFVQPNLNLIELAPKGTGKSYVFSNLSKYGWMFSGGKVTRAKLFYDMGTKAPGIITQKDYVAFDEISTISFSDTSEMLGALKGYLESGKFTLSNFEGTSSAGIILLGNIAITKEGKPKNACFMKELPPMFQESALLDRFHGFIEGWDLIRINEDILLDGVTINVEYFSEILHQLRDDASYNMVVSDLIDVPDGADTRDKNAIFRIATGYLKLLFPHVQNKHDISYDDFENYCLIPAIKKRAIIKEQISMLDPEFKNYVPDFTVKR